MSGSPSSRAIRADRAVRRAQGAHRASRRRASPTLPAARRCSRRWSRCSARADDHLGVRLARGLLYRDLDEATRSEDPCSRRRSKWASGSGGSATMAPRSTSGWTPVSRRKRRHAAVAARRLPARRHRLERPSRFPRRARGRHGDPRQLGRDRRARPRDARARLVQRVRRRWRVQQAAIRLAPPGEDERASAWGKAIRLAQRFSGGTEACCASPALRWGKRIVLTVPALSRCSPRARSNGGSRNWRRRSAGPRRGRIPSRSWRVRRGWRRRARPSAGRRESPSSPSCPWPPSGSPARPRRRAFACRAPGWRAGRRIGQRVIAARRGRLWPVGSAAAGAGGEQQQGHLQTRGA
jgi:hypothetical protein